MNLMRVAQAHGIDLEGAVQCDAVLFGSVRFGSVRCGVASCGAAMPHNARKFARPKWRGFSRVENVEKRATVPRAH